MIGGSADAIALDPVIGGSADAIVPDLAIGGSAEVNATVVTAGSGVREVNRHTIGLRDR